MRLPFVVGRVGIALLLGAAGCGGPAFETRSGVSDSGAFDASADTARAPDAPAGTEGGSSDSGADALGPCAPLAASAVDVYVDQRFKGSPQTGAAACPFPTVLQGVAAAAGHPGTVTVHVAGATPALVYAETGSVTVGANMVLRGDGPTKTTINASGTCGMGTCAVIVAGGGVLDGFTVLSTTGDGILTGVAAPAPILKNVAASGSKGNGVVALGSVELGPNIAASGNGTGGVQSPATAGGRLHVVGSSNAFDNNNGNGINVDGNAVLVFEGGSASGNFQGIRLAGATPSSSGPHTITALTAMNNKGPGGVVAFSGQTIKMRSSKLLGNANVGMLYNYLSGSTLDLGTGLTDLGGNTFGSTTGANRNGKVGLRLCNGGSAGSQPAFGDLWSSCPPTQTFVACDTVVAAYTDVAYAPATTATGPVLATTCTTGP